MKKALVLLALSLGACEAGIEAPETSSADLELQGHDDPSAEWFEGCLYFDEDTGECVQETTTTAPTVPVEEPTTPIRQTEFREGDSWGDADASGLYRYTVPYDPNRSIEWQKEQDRLLGIAYSRGYTLVSEYTRPDGTVGTLHERVEPRKYHLRTKIDPERYYVLPPISSRRD